MAHKKAGGSTSLGRDSASKRLGVKLSDGQWAKTGSIIIRQRGTKYYPGTNVKRANDDSLFSLVNGFVKFTTKKVKRFDGSLKSRKIVSVLLATKNRPAPDPKILATKTPVRKNSSLRTSFRKTRTKNRLTAKKIKLAKTKSNS